MTKYKKKEQNNIADVVVSVYGDVAQVRCMGRMPGLHDLLVGKNPEKKTQTCLLMVIGSVTSDTLFALILSGREWLFRGILRD